MKPKRCLKLNEEQQKKNNFAIMLKISHAYKKKLLQLPSTVTSIDMDDPFLTYETLDLYRFINSRSVVFIQQFIEIFNCLTFTFSLEQDGCMLSGNFKIHKNLKTHWIPAAIPIQRSPRRCLV